VRVRVGLKRSKPRVVGCDALTGELLEAWWQRRQALGIPRRVRFFCTLKGTPLQPRQVRQIVDLLARKAGVEARVHPHALRHSFAAELVREGVALPTLRDALGHGNVRTTDAYVRSLVGDAAVVAAMRDRSWSGPAGDA
jgi:integrase/recombinase XerC